MKELEEKYQLWLKRQYWNEINLRHTPKEMATNLTEREDRRSAYNLAAALSPQGDKVAYLTDRNGTFDIYLMSAIDGKDLGVWSRDKSRLLLSRCLFCGPIYLVTRWPAYCIRR